MRHSVTIVATILSAIVVAIPACHLSAADRPTSKDLVGLWHARRDFGPEVRGRLIITRDGETWRAEIAGRSVPVSVESDEIRFELSDGGGAFRGHFADAAIVGHWIQPHGIAHSFSGSASPVRLGRKPPNMWVGDVKPLDDHMTFFLPITMQGDGTLATFLRNPERNIGKINRVVAIGFDGRTVQWIERRSKVDSGKVIASGPYEVENQSFSIYVPWRGGTYDFSRVTALEEEVFYPRGRTPGRYAYHPPPALDDGWPVGTLADVAISQDSISRFIQTLIDMPMDSLGAPQIHGILIVRHGKLVLEEYFHGFHRDAPHDTRSASKSVTSILTGAAILAGEPIAISTPVYQTMDYSGLPYEDDPRKQAITVEHLLTMSSGLDCDDNSDSSLGTEEIMENQDDPDWYRFTLSQKMVRKAGDSAVYGSANPNLVGGILARTTGQWLPDLFHSLIAEPMQFGQYAINLGPNGDSYMGGGGQFLLRDFMKLGQMMMDGGKWHGKQIISEEWARESTKPRYKMSKTSQYGYLWWVTDYLYKDRTVRAFFASGNGGNSVMAIPDLDLVVGFYGASYADAAGHAHYRIFVPQYILPAVGQE